MYIARILRRKIRPALPENLRIAPRCPAGKYPGPKERALKGGCLRAAILQVEKADNMPRFTKDGYSGIFPVAVDKNPAGPENRIAGLANGARFGLIGETLFPGPWSGPGDTAPGSIRKPYYPPFRKRVLYPGPRTDGCILMSWSAGRLHRPGKYP